MAEKCPKCPKPDLPPGIAALVWSMDKADPRYRRPQPGWLVLGFYRRGDSVEPVLLWADPEAREFWDVARRQHVAPPDDYIHVADECPFDPYTGHAVVDGAVCPF